MTATSKILTQEEARFRVKNLFDRKGKATEDTNAAAEVLNSHAALLSRCRELEEQALRMARHIVAMNPGHRCPVDDCVIKLSESIIHQHNESEKKNECQNG